MGKDGKEVETSFFEYVQGIFQCKTIKEIDNYDSIHIIKESITKE